MFRHPILVALAVLGCVWGAIGAIGNIDTVGDIYEGQSKTMHWLAHIAFSPYGGAVVAIGCLIAIVVLDRRGVPAARTKEAVKKLAELRDYAIHNLQNREVGSRDDQDVLDSDRHAWMAEVVAVAEKGGASQSDLTRIRTLGTYQPKGLPALVANVGQAILPSGVVDTKLVARNAKHRNEVAERNERLEAVIKNLEAKL